MKKTKMRKIGFRVLQLVIIGWIHADASHMYDLIYGIYFSVSLYSWCYITVHMAPGTDFI